MPQHPHQVKGSQAAKDHMAKLRSMRGGGLGRGRGRGRGGRGGARGGAFKNLAPAKDVLKRLGMNPGLIKEPNPTSFLPPRDPRQRKGGALTGPLSAIVKPPVLPFDLSKNDRAARARGGSGGGLFTGKLHEATRVARRVAKGGGLLKAFGIHDTLRKGHLGGEFQIFKKHAARHAKGGSLKPAHVAHAKALQKMGGHLDLAKRVDREAKKGPVTGKGKGGGFFDYLSELFFGDQRGDNPFREEGSTENTGWSVMKDLVEPVMNFTGLGGIDLSAPNLDRPAARETGQPTSGLSQGIIGAVSGVGRAARGVENLFRGESGAAVQKIKEVGTAARDIGSALAGTAKVVGEGVVGPAARDILAGRTITRGGGFTGAFQQSETSGPGVLGPQFKALQKQAQRHAEGGGLNPLHRAHAKALMGMGGHMDLARKLDRSKRSAKGGGFMDYMQSLFSSGRQGAFSGITNAIRGAVDQFRSFSEFPSGEELQFAGIENQLKGLRASGASLQKALGGQGGGFSSDAFPGIRGGQSDAQREMQRAKRRDRPRVLPVANQGLSAKPLSLAGDFALFKRAARKQAQGGAFKGPQQDHLNRLMSFRGHRQFLDHVQHQPKGGGFVKMLQSVAAQSPHPHSSLQSEFKKRPPRPTHELVVPPTAPGRGRVSRRGRGGGLASGVASTVASKMARLHGPPVLGGPAPLRGQSGQ